MNAGWVVGTPASPAVRRHGNSPPRLPPYWQMSTYRQPASLQSARAGNSPTHAVSLSSLIFQALVLYLCAENRLAQVLRCHRMESQWGFGAVCSLAAHGGARARQAPLLAGT